MQVLTVEILPKNYKDYTKEEGEILDIINEFYLLSSKVKIEIKSGHIFLDKNHILYSEGTGKYIIDVYDHLNIVDINTVDLNLTNTNLNILTTDIDNLIPDVNNYLLFIPKSTIYPNLLSKGYTQEQTEYLDRFFDLISDHLFKYLRINNSLQSVFKKCHVYVSSYYRTDSIVFFVQLHAHRKEILPHEKQLIFSHLEESFYVLINDLLKYINLIKKQVDKLGLSNSLNFSDSVVNFVDLKLTDLRKELLKKLYAES